LVTGGASGIGAATCEILSSRGWGVVVADIDVSAAKGVAANRRGHSVSINVMDASSIAIAAASIESSLGAIYGLVSCAALAVMQLCIPHSERRAANTKSNII
jgi:NAD(P)-dependent dehydrogenase (short-subunit alcohol dehydrogenase family)